MRRAMWAPHDAGASEANKQQSSDRSLARGCEADRALLHHQRREALPKPGQMRRLQMGVKCRPAVIHLIEEDVVRRSFHLDNVELSAAWLVGNRMAGIVLRQSQEGVKTVQFDHEFRDYHEGGRL